MRTIGHIADISRDFRTNKIKLTFLADEFVATDELDDLIKSNVVIDIKKHREKRSLDANGYFWKLCDMLSEALQCPKTEIYKSMIKDIGGVSETVLIAADGVQRLADEWKAKGVGWQCDIMPSKHKGYNTIILYYGSSTYDTSQMSRLIDLAVEECKAQGIVTDTPEKVEAIKALWKA